MTPYWQTFSLHIVSVGLHLSVGSSHHVTQLMSMAWQFRTICYSALVIYESVMILVSPVNTSQRVSCIYSRPAAFQPQLVFSHDYHPQVIGFRKQFQSSINSTTTMFYVSNVTSLLIDWHQVNESQCRCNQKICQPVKSVLNLCILVASQQLMTS